MVHFVPYKIFTNAFFCSNIEEIVGNQIEFKKHNCNKELLLQRNDNDKIF